MRYFKADVAQLDAVNAYLEENLNGSGLAEADVMKLMMAVEEVFVNIAHYAYKHPPGLVGIACDVACDPVRVGLEFRDEGTPFNPLARPDPDLTQNLEQRVPGGLGIFLTKKFMDRVEYRYEDGANILYMEKTMKKAAP